LLDFRIQVVIVIKTREKTKKKINKKHLSKRKNPKKSSEAIKHNSKKSWTAGFHQSIVRSTIKRKKVKNHLATAMIAAI